MTLDESPRALHAAAMPALPLLSLPSLLVLLAACLPAQLALPGGTGNLSPGTDWIVLRSAELLAATRASDPAAEPARTMLQSVIAEIAQQGRSADHVLLQGRGPDGQLRLANLWSAPGSTSGATLREATVVDGIRDTLLSGLRTGETQVTYGGHADPGLFANGSLRLRFRCERSGLSWNIDHHIVPAGESLQYCEVLTSPDDSGALAAAEALLRTFDGARDGKSGTSMVLPLVLGGALGGVLGTMVSRWRLRKLRQQQGA